MGENGSVPGTSAMQWPPGTVKRIPAGSKIVLNIHYSRTSATVETDRSMVGLVFAQEPPRREVLTRFVSNHYFRIPAGAEHHEATRKRRTLRKPALVTASPSPRGRRGTSRASGCRRRTRTA